MPATNNKFKLSKDLDIDSLHDSFMQTGKIHIPDILQSESANIIYELLKQQEDWNFVYNLSGKHIDANAKDISSWTKQDQAKLLSLIHGQASTGFQYKYQSIPIYDIYHQNLLPGHIFNSIFEFINGSDFLHFVRTVTNETSISFADAQATKFLTGDFLTKHNDDVAGKNRKVAYVLNFSKDWRPDWGGALQFFDKEGHIDAAYTPAYNALNLFTVPMDHSVGYVAPFAGLPRLSITGWLRAGSD